MNGRIAAFAAAVSAFPLAAGAAPVTALDWSDIAHVHSATCIHNAPARAGGLQALTGGAASSSELASPGLSLLPINPNGTPGQVVFVDFEAPSPTFTVALQLLNGTTAPTPFVSPVNGQSVWTTFQYTPAERAEILDRMRKDYKGFNIEFTDVRPVSGDFETSRMNALNISGTPNITAVQVDVNGDGVFDPNVDRYGFSILFGQADRIDFGNRNRNDVARTDANLWTFLNQAGYVSIGGVPVNDPVVVRGLTLDQASATGSHEVGHNQGLRHHDAAGPIGAGINNLGSALSATRFAPVYPGPRAAVDTNLHIMASGASTGEGIDPRQDPFFGLREAAKLAHNEQAPLGNTEATLMPVGPTSLTFTNLPQIFGNFGDNRGLLSQALLLEQTVLNVPKTVTGGLEFTSSIVTGGIETSSVQGSLALPTVDAAGILLDIDAYQVRLNRRSLVSIEAFSFAGLVVQYLAIYDSNFNLMTDFYATPAVNLFEGEASFPFLLDYVVPRTGNYYILTWSPFNTLRLGFGLAPGQFASGNYELYISEYLVPAPAALSLFGLGVMAVAAARRRKRA
jgi:hypothetical protein